VLLSAVRKLRHAVSATHYLMFSSVFDVRLVLMSANRTVAICGTAFYKCPLHTANSILSKVMWSLQVGSTSHRLF
jgi:hypothetical protein